MITGLGSVSPEEYARTFAAHEAALRALEASISRLETEDTTVQRELYDHLSMQQAVANDKKRAIAAIRSNGIKMGAGFGIAAAAGFACVASGSVIAGLVAAGAATVAYMAARTRTSAREAVAKMEPMQEVCDRCVSEAEQRHRDIEQNLGSARSEVAAHRAQLELIEMARRVSTPPAPAQQITQGADAVRIGNVTVPRSRPTP